MPTSRVRAAIAAAFLVQGLVFVTLTTRLPQFSDRWDLDEVELSLILLAIVLLAGVGSVLAERVAARRDSATMLRAGLLLVALAVPVFSAAPSVLVLVGGLVLYGLGVGIVDATTNMQGVALEHRVDRPLLPSFHGAWTLGGVLGAAGTLVAAEAPLPAVGLLGLAPLAVAFLPYAARDHGPADGPEVEVPWRPLWLVGAGLVLFYSVDTAAASWGPTYLDRTLDSPERLVALATFPYLLASGLVRLAGDHLVAGLGPVKVLRAGAVVAFVALALVVFAPSWQVAVAGFTLLGAGVAVIAPLSFSAAARIAAGDDAGDADPAARHARVDAVIARFNQFNYAGALIGSVLTGLVGAGSLRVGFAVPMVLVLAMLPLARAFAPAPRALGTRAPAAPPAPR
nr:MFS transporter [Nocardioides ferulae]